jgi:hypothetical protein
MTTDGGKLRSSADRADPRTEIANQQFSGEDWANSTIRRDRKLPRLVNIQRSRALDDRLHHNPQPIEGHHRRPGASEY